jgi:hypothetical protein
MHSVRSRLNVANHDLHGLAISDPIWNVHAPMHACFPRRIRAKCSIRRKRSHCSRIFGMGSDKRTKVARRQIKQFAMLYLMNFCDGKCMR